MKNNSLGLTLPEILFLIGSQVRTGELIMEAGNNIGTIVFHDGNIIQAFSPYSRAIGDLIVEKGLISEAELIETLKLQKRNTYTPLGGLLVKLGRVTVEVVEKMVQEQIRQSVTEFQSWNGIAFSFSDKTVTPFDGIHLRVHEFIPQGIMDAARTFLFAKAEPPQSSSLATGLSA